MKTNCFLLSLAAAAALPGMAFAQSSYLVDPSNTSNHSVIVAPGGNVGIGTTGPNAPLEVAGPSAKIRLNRTDGTGMFDLNISAVMAGSSADFFINPGQASSGIVFRTADSAGALVDALGIDYHGNVGIGTIAPQEKLEVFGGIMTQGPTPGFSRFILKSTAAGGQQYEWYNDATGPGSGVLALYNRTADNRPIAFTSAGNVGIGTTSPGQKLDIDGNARVNGGVPYFAIKPNEWNDSVYIQANMNVDGTGNGNGNRDYLMTAVPINKGFVFFQSQVGPKMVIAPNGNVGVGTTAPTEKLEVAGTIKCQVLDLSGADLAEKFDISGEPSPGTVVCADPERDGQLCVATREYDDSVIGVVGGAGGITPGLLLHQPGVADGAHAVAMVGRVYVLADATFGEIKPGAALTTSPTPGHAMKATDKSRAPGAILGTALSTLKEGQGLVLVAIQRR